jgi:hypothetical protein
MDVTESHIDRWLERGSKFFKTVARNPVVRAALLARGLTDDELQRGWSLYSDLHGFGSPVAARPATNETVAAQAINEIDAWDAPTFNATEAVLGSRAPDVARYLFDNLEAAVGVAAVAGAERFLDRIAALREGTAKGVSSESAKAALDLLAARQIIDPKREEELRALIDKARRGAQPDEAIPAPEMDPARRQVAEAFIGWLNEWREIGRLAVHRRDYRISLGLAQRRQADDAAQEDPPAEPPPRVAVAATR